MTSSVYKFDFRYTALLKPMGARKQRLVDSLAVQQLFRDVEDEEAWIREKEPIISSSNRGKDLIGVHNLIKKHTNMSGEINNHEPKLDQLYQNAHTMVDEGHFAADEIKNRISHLKVCELTGSAISFGRIKKSYF